MQRIILLSLVATLALAACSLERNNPLDPQNNNNIVTPQPVSELDLTCSGSGSPVKWIEATWNRNDDAEGYYLYRALSYNGSYQNLTPNGIPNVSTPLYTDYDVRSGNYYYYKVSAYNKEGLEGPISAPQGPISLPAERFAP